jgi:hypothetical protein
MFTLIRRAILPLLLAAAATSPAGFALAARGPMHPYRAGGGATATGTTHTCHGGMMHSATKHTTAHLHRTGK